MIISSLQVGAYLGAKVKRVDCYSDVISGLDVYVLKLQGLIVMVQPLLPLSSTIVLHCLHCKRVIKLILDIVYISYIWSFKADLFQTSKPSTRFG